MPGSTLDVAAGAPNPADLILEGGVVVYDRVTRLHWGASPLAKNVTYADADMACSKSPTPGGFRLPTMVELATLLDLGRTPPKIVGEITGVTQFVWTSTADSSDPAAHVAFDFSNGTSRYLVSNLLGDALCVY
jgi:hypothetical protein